MHTSDFFVIYSDSAGWVECKTERDLLKLSAKNSNRYRLNQSEKWICPPGEEYASEFDLSYWVRSNSEINWTYQRNIEFLDDYYRSNKLKVSRGKQDEIINLVKNELAITLDQLYKRLQIININEDEQAVSITKDDIHLMIAHNEIYVDLDKELLTEPNKVRVFVNDLTSQAYSNIFRLNLDNKSKDVLTQTSENGNGDSKQKTKTINLVPNANVIWDGQAWKILNFGEDEVSLIDKSKEIIQVPLKVFEKLIITGEVSDPLNYERDEIHTEVKQRLACAKIEHLESANYRVAIVRASFNGDDLPNKIPARTLRDWKSKYRNAEKCYGNGYIGLLPKPKVGNRKDRLDVFAKNLLEKFIEDEYETIKQKNSHSVYGSYLQACEKKSILPVSYKTFRKYIKKRPKYKQTLKRKGKRAAYKHEKFYWELSETTPKHGERPFHIVHIDHTELDIELVDSFTNKNFGRPWLTLMTDAYSRRILAVYLTFDAPSYRSCLMAIRECVRKHGRFPQILVVDGGKDFSSTYFETLLAYYETTKKTRPPAKSRFGSTVERLFGTTNTRFINNLQGNTQITKNVRQITKSVNPKKHAIWTLAKLFERMCEFCYEVYDQTEHSTLLQTPQNVFAQGMLAFGKRDNRLIPYDEHFKMMTLPTTPKGTAKVDGNRGIKIRNIYYWADEFRHPEIIKTQVPIRYDPWDVGTSYALISGKWKKCISEHYKTFQHRTEKEIYLITKELRKRQQKHSKQFNVTASKIAQFIYSAEADEALMKQRIADRESRAVFSLINGGSLVENELSSTNQSNTNPSVMIKEENILDKDKSQIQQETESVEDIKNEDYEDEEIVIYPTL